jgi:hypothetical protein
MNVNQPKFVIVRSNGPTAADGFFAGRTTHFAIPARMSFNVEP